MKDKKRTKEDLIKELNLLRRQLVELKEAGIKRKAKEEMGIKIDERREKLIKVFEAMEDGVYIVNQQYDIEYINPVLEKEFGPWQGIKCYTYFHDRSEVCPWCPNQKVFAGETVRWEWYSFKNGKTYDLIDSPLRNPDGTISKLEIFHDITERKKIEEVMRRGQKEWEATFDAITDPLFIHDKEFKIVRANRAYRNAAGMEFSEIIGKPYYKVFPKMEGPFRMCLKVQELQEEEEEEEFFYPITDSVFKIRFYPIKDVNGSYLYSIHIIEDITEATRNAEKIKEAESRYRTIFEQSPAGILIINSEPPFLPIEFNDTAFRQLGYSREEFAKLRVSDYETIDSPEEIETRAERLLREGNDSFETKHRTKNGEIRNVIVTIQTLMLSGKSFFYCVFRDITEIRKVEEKLKQRVEELERYKKATIQRELRMKELKEKVEKMEMEKEKDSPE